ncbi:unnamed protein product [Didymodactylos carnosus]|uniref:Geranylgeranyl diphosphate synthase n=1 Tax=Didymodactylos carnosus TaxID=1234261 RepID=A0A815UAL6_9BILA|nr:unnamed protein product [Didymodactylos carnosus]CAF4377014.1 unnamed protein product [Didymodactylos carnosus]
MENETSDPDAENRILLEPYEYIRTIPGKQIRPKLIKAFNHWLHIPDEKLLIISEITEMLHNASLLIDDIQDNSKLRRGSPVAHAIYGAPLTINAANFVYFLALEKALTLNHPDVTKLFVEQLIELHHGQGMEIWWRDNFVAPSEDEYRTMVIQKCGGLLNIGIRLMQLFSTEQQNFHSICQLLSLLFQIRDDYCNLIFNEHIQHKSYCEDLTEGKFSFPVIHAINTHDNDTRIIHILKQRTHDYELKSYCLHLLHEFGSIKYTKRVCCDLAKSTFEEIDFLGGNIYLENIVRTLMKVFDEPDDDEQRRSTNKFGANNNILATDELDDDEEEEEYYSNNGYDDDNNQSNSQDEQEYVNGNDSINYTLQKTQKKFTNNNSKTNNGKFSPVYQQQTTNNIPYSSRFDS